MAKSLANNATLHTLDLRYNSINLDRVDELVNILEGNYTLTCVHLGRFNKQLEEIINRNKIMLDERRFKIIKKAVPIVD